MTKRTKKKKEQGFVSPRQELRESTRLNAKDLLGGGVLSRDVVIRQIPFILFLFFMLLFYIANQYRGQHIMQEIMTLEARVRRLRNEFISTSFTLQKMSKQSTVIRQIRERHLNLEEALVPPYKIIIDE